MQAIVANIRDFYARMFWQWESSTTEYGDGYVLSYSGVRWLSGANQLWVDDPEAMSAQLLGYSVSYFRPHIAEWSVLAIPEGQPGLKEKCLKYGCFTRWNCPLMVLDGPALVLQGKNGITVERVHGEVAQEQARQLVGEIFHMDERVNERLIRPEHAGDPLMRHYIGYLHGHPAAAGTMAFSEGIASVWNVGTRRQFRKQGLAKALMGRMCDDARQEGYRRVILLSSDMGEPLYSKIGFRTIGEAYYLGAAAY